MKTRWLLTWKDPPKESGDTTKKAKARLVASGYADPDLNELQRDAPTLALRTRMIIFSIAAASHWTLLKGHIKTAFLQGDKDKI